MRPNNFVLANFANRKTCLCTQHQNLALKLKMLKKYKPVPTNPEAFAKFTDEKIISILESINEKSFTFNIWKKVDIVNKGKKLKKMKMVLQTHPYLQFKDILMKEVHSFRSHVNRVYTQFKQQKNLKENLPDNNVDFLEDYRCKSQNEIQSAYWSPTQITIHPVVITKFEEKKRTVIRVSFSFQVNLTTT